MARKTKVLPKLAEDTSWIYSEYYRLNNTYWKGALPHDVPIYIIPPEGEGSGLIPKDEHGCTMFLDGSDTVAKIELNEDILKDKTFARMVLMHEMVHIAIREKYPRTDHGEKFKAEVKRISRLGALIEVLN